MIYYLFCWWRRQRWNRFAVAISLIFADKVFQTVHCWSEHFVFTNVDYWRVRGCTENGVWRCSLALLIEWCDWIGENNENFHGAASGFFYFPPNSVIRTIFYVFINTDTF
jgi:hypothetical protein